MKERLNYIDQLKGFAILCVVFGHVVHFCLKNEDILFYRVITSFHMPLFAFLSGLMFKRLVIFNEVYIKFLAQSKKLLFPFSIIGLTYAYLVMHSGGGDFIRNSAKYGYWYLLFLWQCYLMTHLYNVLIQKHVLGNCKMKILVDALWLITVVGVFKLISMKSNPISDFIGSIWMFRLYPFFFFAHVVKREQMFSGLFDNRQKTFDWMGIGYIIFFVLTRTVFCGSISLSYIAAPFGVYVWVYIFYKFRVKRNKFVGILESFGQKSLEIYVFHYFFIKSCDLSFLSDSIGNGTNILPITLFAISIAFVIAGICLALSWMIRQNGVLTKIVLGE